MKPDSLTLRECIFHTLFAWILIIPIGLMVLFGRVILPLKSGMQSFNEKTLFREVSAGGYWSVTFLFAAFGLGLIAIGVKVSLDSTKFKRSRWVGLHDKPVKIGVTDIASEIVGNVIDKDD